MRLSICLLLLLAGCTDTDSAAESDSAAEPESVLRMTGRLDYRSLDEASGLAQSRRDPDLLWAVNDDGPPEIFAIGKDGGKRGKVEIRKAGHRDWEDMAAFELDGRPYLLIADIGDNEARRNDVSLYVVEEPLPGEKKVDYAWRIDFTYPEGPRDAEAIAVDAAAGQILVLSKRDIPARLYALPLRPDADDRVIAEYLGVTSSLPLPSRNDVNAAPLTDNWHWQPTAMAFAADASAALILTYGGVYYFPRDPGQSWQDALTSIPLGLPLGRIRRAESITFNSNGDAAYLTVERREAPLIRVDLADVSRQ